MQGGKDQIRLGRDETMLVVGLLLTMPDSAQSLKRMLDKKIT